MKRWYWIVLVCVCLAGCGHQQANLTCHLDSPDKRTITFTSEQNDVQTITETVIREAGPEANVEKIVKEFQNSTHYSENVQGLKYEIYSQGPEVYRVLTVDLNNIPRKVLADLDLVDDDLLEETQQRYRLDAAKYREYLEQQQNARCSETEE